MTFTFTPKTEEEIQRDGLLEAGTYDFEIVSAVAKESKSGNPMIHVKLKVFESDTENFRFVDDYLMEKMAYKLRHAMVATGLEEIYNSGSFDPELLVGKHGKLILSVQEDKTGQYGPRNSVKDYVITDVIAQSEEELDDEIKF